MKSSWVRIIALGAALLVLGGCTALVVGGAAAGGYVMGKDERPVGTQVDDKTITASVKTRLLADKYLRSRALYMDVDTWEGVVTLHGSVSSYVEHAQAGKIAASVDGVKSVTNKLKVVPPEKTEE